MRIAHICTKFSRISETFIYDLVVGLERAGTENHVITAARVNAAERPFPRVRVLPIALWRQAVFVARKRAFNVYRFPMPLRATRDALREIRPDVVLAHFGGMGAAVGPVAREMGIPLCVVFHAFDLFMRPFRPATYATLWSTGAQAIAVSRHGERRLLELGCPADRVRVIHCGVDVARFGVCDTARSAANGLRLASVGRLVEKKGFDDAIRAVATLRKNGAHMVRLDIWGNGPCRRRLVRLSRRLGVDDLVSFRGSVAARDVPSLLRDYDVFVLPSRTARNGDAEGIPITLLEAQAAERPVVATLHAGIPEAIPPEHHGLLAREGDAEDLAQKLASLAAWRDEWEAIGRRGREWVAERFSLSGEIEEYLRLFRGLCSPSRSAGEGV